MSLEVFEQAAQLGTLEAAATYLESQDVLTFGVESVSVGPYTLDFISVGDPYGTTVGRENGTLTVITWGGWFEEMEQQYCLEEGLCRCHYCGKYTPYDDVEVELFCEHCGAII